MGRTKIPGIKIQDTRLLRLMEVVLHQGSRFAGWTIADVHTVLLRTFTLSDKKYTLTKLRYILRKIKAHGLPERDGRHYR